MRSVKIPMGVLPPEHMDKLHTNVRRINTGEAIHPVNDHPSMSEARVAGKAMYKRFYGDGKQMP